MEPRQRNCLPVPDNASTAPVQVGASRLRGPRAVPSADTATN